MITIVKDLKLGQIWFIDGVVCEIVNFPTRSTVCLENINHMSPEWASAKISIRELKDNGRYFRALRRVTIVANPAHRNSWITNPPQGEKED